jgi:hypothetical protein
MRKTNTEHMWVKVLLEAPASQGVYHGYSVSPRTAFTTVFQVIWIHTAILEPLFNVKKRWIRPRGKKKTWQVNITGSSQEPKLKVCSSPG